MNNPSKNTFRRFLSALGRSVSTRTRLAFGLSLFTATAILLAQFLGLIPDPNQPRMEARKLQTETLAITGSAVAATPNGLESFHRTLENMKERAEQIKSIGLRNVITTKLEFECGDHQENWSMPTSGMSNDQFMFVPILRKGKQVAQLELCYEPLVSAKSFLQSKTTRLAVFVFGLSFFFFYWRLSQTLKQLDPRGAVPKRVREAFDTMAEGLLILDRKGQVMLANSRFGSLVGIDADRLTANSITELPWQLPAGELPWEVAAESLQPVSESVLKIVDFNHEERTFMVSAAPVMGRDDTARGVIVTFDDITILEDQKKELVKARKAADAANEAKSSFLSRMSHEIRTPMNAIIGYTDVLQQGQVQPEEQVRYLTTIQSSGEHLLALINDILDLSKVEAGQMTVERRPVPLVATMSNVIDTLNVKAEQNDIYLKMEVEGRVPRIVETDDTRLRQVLINTVGNAIKFTQQGGVRLVARMAKVDERQMLQFDVIDTGIGMSDEAAEKIFDPFTQADDSVTRKFGGTGLGLAISKQLSESLGGGITVKSQEGVGTVFTISIDPGSISADAECITDIDSEKNYLPEKPKTRLKFTGGHVLIVDDGQANRDLAGVMLKRAGLTFDMATNGVEAIEKIADTEFDVVLMDMHMPIMDGLAATRHIRAAGLDFPIVALTALGTDEERQTCLDEGCNAFLPKPVRLDSMMETLGQFLELDDTAETIGHNAEQLSANPALPTPALNVENAPNKFPSDVTDVEEEGLIYSNLPDDDEFDEIISDFIALLPAKFAEFDAALESNDTDRLRKLGHWLAGSSGTVGFSEFVDPAREIESCPPEQFATLIAKCKAISKRVVVTRKPVCK